jgi:pimeloyl-ACP methyl ester carboxylesterase
MRWAVAVVCCAVQGCALLQAPTPMGSVQLAPPAEPRCVLVLFPGAGDHADDYVKEGFLKRVQDRGLPVAVAAADATMGYYFTNTLQPRVEADVIAPLKAKYPNAKLWVAGISMGGFGALFYAQQHADQVEGVLVMAPFLGGPEIAQEVRASGGLGKWKAPEKAPPTDANFSRQLWRWLKEVTTPGARGPQLHLGYGVDDGISVQGAVLAAALPSGRVTIKPGGHVWAAWTPIFEDFLDGKAFRAACGPAAAP